MRFGTFAHQVTVLATNEAPAEFSLFPLGLDIKVRIVKNTDDVTGNSPVWDTVYLNDKCCGNRFGAIQEFAKLVEQEQNRQLLEKIYNGIHKQTFADWHNREFEDHVTGEDNCRTKEQILADITKLFGLDK